VEGAVSAVLGIDFNRNSEKNQYKLTQAGLVDKVLEAINMQDCNEKSIPCNPDGKPLGTDKVVLLLIKNGIAPLSLELQTQHCL
jgi:hypothetical protein